MKTFIIFNIFLIYSIWYLAWIIYPSNNRIKMKFKDWKALYKISPNRWEIKKLHPTDKLKRIRHTHEHCLVYFGFIDAFKYLIYYFFYYK